MRARRREANSRASLRWVGRLWVSRMEVPASRGVDMVVFLRDMFACVGLGEGRGAVFKSMRGGRWAP